MEAGEALKNLEVHASLGVRQLKLSGHHAHLTVRDHLHSGEVFADPKVHKIIQACIRTLNIRDRIEDPEIIKRAEDKLFEILKGEPIHGVTIERE
jgi:hypothetical protein